MHRNAIWIIFFGLILGGCASDRKIETMESSGGNTSTPAVSSPTMSAPGSHRIDFHKPENVRCGSHRIECHEPVEINKPDPYRGRS